MAGIASFTKLERINRSDSCSVFTLFSEISEKKSKLLRENLAKKNYVENIVRVIFFMLNLFLAFLFAFYFKMSVKK